MNLRISLIIGIAATLFYYSSALAQNALLKDTPRRLQAPWILNDNTHFLALGDSLTAGYGAFPVTQGYAYLLYRDGVYDRVANTSFANAAMPGATSGELLNFEAPLAAKSGFLAQPPAGVVSKTPSRVVVMTIGGNDLLELLTLPNPTDNDAIKLKISTFASNLSASLTQLCTLTNIRIYIGNLYDIQNFPIPIKLVVGEFNGALQKVVDALNVSLCPGNVKVADVYSQFLGDQRALLLINRPGADKFEVHPSDAGHRAIERAFILAK
jgi:lysophospholipase L1-like esterase